MFLSSKIVHPRNSYVVYEFCAGAVMLPINNGETSCQLIVRASECMDVTTNSKAQKTTAVNIVVPIKLTIFYYFIFMDQISIRN